MKKLFHILIFVGTFSISYGQTNFYRQLASKEEYERIKKDILN